MSKNATPAKRSASAANTDTPNKKQKLAIEHPEPSFSAADELVTFLIGPDLKRFMVHKEVACLHSPVFKAAFNSNFIEGQTQTYKLKDTTVDAFRFVVQWFYNGKFNKLVKTVADGETSAATPSNVRSEPTSQAEEINETAVEKKSFSQDFLEKARERVFSMCRVWVLADRLQIPRLQNMAIDELERIHIDGWLGYGMVSLVYNSEKLSVPKGAALRLYTMEVFRKYTKVEGLEKYPDCFHKDWLLECFIAFKATSDRPDPFKDRDEFKRRFHVPEDV